jgi:hypothetical protein
MERELFVVHVGHNTAHGLAGNVVMVTENVAVALTAAFSAELMGYEFYDESYVAVDRLEPERAYHKREYRWRMDAHAPRHVVLCRYRRRVDAPVGTPPRTYRWEDAWFDEEIRERYEKAMAPVATL